MELATVAPLVLPIDPSGTAFEGFLSPSSADGSQEAVAALWLRLTGVAPVGPARLRTARLEVNAPLAALLDGHHELVAERLRESGSLPDFLLELRSIVDQAYLATSAARAGVRAPVAAPNRTAAFFSSLREEVLAVGWERVANLAPDLSALTLRLADMRGRQHELRLALPPGYPAVPPAAAADLPLPFEPRWGGDGGGLPQLVRQFEEALERHQEFWAHLDDLDAHAWVIEPHNPPRSCTHRRLALGGHVTLSVTLDPLRPSAPPAWQLMGADAAVAPLRQRLHAHTAARWREGALLRHNLEAVLELDLPAREGGDAGGGAGGDDASVECSICYAYRLPLPGGQEGEGDVPDIACANPHCAKPYHRVCLVEWLNADTSTRTSLNTLFGACPFCSEAITVRITAA